MKSVAKFAGKKTDWIQSTPEQKKEWSFERRPGGWIIGTWTSEGTLKERIRFYYSKSKQQFFAKLREGNSLDFFGERIAEVRGGAQGNSESDYTAQFPGKVRKILVQEGASVSEGTPILMVEAMKMEFAVKASSAGTVKKIHVVEGATLSPGQKLIDFEEVKKAKSWLKFLR